MQKISESLVSNLQNLGTFYQQAMSDGELNVSVIIIAKNTFKEAEKYSFFGRNQLLWEGATLPAAWLREEDEKEAMLSVEDAIKCIDTLLSLAPASELNLSKSKLKKRVQKLADMLRMKRGFGGYGDGDGTP